jgi:uncharacterized protein (TIGR02611 family)
MIHFTKRVIKIVIGFALLLGGIVMLVTPGPGWAAIFGGLFLLAREFHWAHRLLEYLKARFRQIRDAALRSEKKGAPPATAGAKSDAAPPPREVSSLHKKA